MPDNAERVARNTSTAVNCAIQTAIADSLRAYADHPERIFSRLRELDAEWDIERTLEANAATIAFIGIVLGATVDRLWLAVPAIVTAFLFQHAIQGSCPPLPIMRCLGVRTAREIDTERTALKELHGDFAQLEGADSKATAALRAAQA